MHGEHSIPTVQPNLRGVDLHGADLRGAFLKDATLQGADLSDTLLSGADLRGAHLEGANLSRAFLAGQYTETGQWPPANLRQTFFDHATNLAGVVFGTARGNAVLLADVHWNDVNLTVVDWSLLATIGDDDEARRRKFVGSYRRAARANHQLAVALQDQGLNEEAMSFAYQARVRRREVLLLQALMRPATSRQQHWLVRLLRLRMRSSRFWLALAVVLPFLIGIASLLQLLGYQLVAVDGALYLLLAFLVLFVLWLGLPPLHKLVLLLIFLTLILPALMLLVSLSLLSALIARLAGPAAFPPLQVLTLAGIFLVESAVLVLVLWQRAPRWFEPVRKRLSPKVEGYRSLYLLFKYTCVDYGRFLFSIFLDILAGYGYKPWKSIVCYLAVIVSFALVYLIIGYTDGVTAALAAHKTVVVPLLTPLEAFVYSLTSFHGRGFFPGSGIRLDDPLVVGAAFEAVIGLVIEVSFIATFTKRFFGN